MYNPNLSPTQRAINTKRIHSIHGATIRERTYEDNPTLPYADTSVRLAIEEKKETATRKSAAPYHRNVIGQLALFRENFAPTARLTINKQPNGNGYHRLTEYDADGNPLWVLADKPMSGNALYIWRRDSSDTDPDTALATTKNQAKKHGCQAVVHPTGWDNLDKEAILDWHNNKVIEALTRTATRQLIAN